MMIQAKHWNSLIEPGITAIVGAGGKTTVLSKLVEYAGLIGQPTLVTTTTKLYESQVALWNPFTGLILMMRKMHVTKLCSGDGVQLGSAVWTAPK